VTALVLQEIFGGELLLADVLNEDGSRQGVHFWNRLPGGLEVDLTRGQFKPSEVVQKPEGHRSAIGPQHRSPLSAVPGAGKRS